MVREFHSDGVSEMVGPPSQVIAPLCPSLKLLQLQYKRWMRGPDKKALIVALGDIVGSWQPEIKSSFSLWLCFDEVLKESHWTIGKLVRKIENLKDGDLVLGISTLHAIIPMSMLLPEHGVALLPFMNVESLHLFAGGSTPLEFQFICDHMELMVYDYGQLPLSSPLPCILPLFSALRVLVTKCDDISFLLGHIFHKLEKCRLLKGSQLQHSPIQGRLAKIGMPVCTRVDIDDLGALVAFKLPQIHELAVDFSDQNHSGIGEKHITVHANLWGLNLLHMKDWPTDGDLVPILRSFPLLETLIITTLSYTDSFRAFLPMDANWISGLKQESGEGKAVDVLCPKLRHLQLEFSKEQRHLMYLTKDIITLHAECGYHLKIFTISGSLPRLGRKFELIQRDGSFTVEMSALAGGAANFKLDI